MIEVIWDYPGNGHETPFTWPNGWPLPSPGDFVYDEDDRPHPVLQVCFHPLGQPPYVYIQCGA